MLKKNFPFVHQLDSMQCGVACLQMVCKYYGKDFTSSELDDLCPASKEGVSMLSMKKAAEHIGFRTVCGKFALKDLSKIQMPCILHWNQSHFVVLYKIKRHKRTMAFCVADPYKGKIEYKEEDMLDYWTCIRNEITEKGIAMLLFPTQMFFENQKYCKTKETTWQFLLQYLAQYKWQLGQIALGMAIGCLLQTIFPLLTQAIVDMGIHDKNIDFVYLILIGQVALTLGGCGLDMVRSWLMLFVGIRVNIKLVTDFFVKLQNLPMSFFGVKKTGDLLQRINDYGRVQNFILNSVLSICFSVLNFIILSFVLLHYDNLIFLVFTCFSLIHVGWTWIFLKRRRTLDFDNFEKQALSQNKTLQMIDNMQEIKLQGCKMRRLWEWEDAQLDIYNVQEKSLRLSQTEGIGGTLINNVKGIFVIVMSAKAVIDGSISFGMMLAIQYIVGQLASPVEDIMNFIYSMQDLKISLERINDIRMKKSESDYSKNLIPSFTNKTIRLEHLSFRYEQYALTDTLSDINLNIEAGKVTAIVGASGSGKTTLLKLLLGYYPNFEGKITIGDNSLQDVDIDTWRSNCGVVMQEGKIFSESIARNIAVDDSDIDTDRLNQAIAIANLGAYVNSLPLKQNTLIGMEGRGVSVGQKQRILIARAAYKNPKFLFLDEATNSLDSTNEKQIVNNLKCFFKGRTVLLIAHRLSTVKDADHIIVMDAGKIVEEGVHESLIEKRGFYYKLIKNQLEL